MPKHCLATATTLVALATPSFADLSAQDVWANLQETATAIGADMTVERVETTSGGLVLHGLRREITLFGMIDLRADLAAVTLRDTGDTVQITWSDTLDIALGFDMGAAGQTVSKGVFTFTDAQGTASGTAEDILYVYGFADLSGTTVTETVTLAGPQVSQTDIKMGGMSARVRGLPGTLENPVEIDSTMVSFTNTTRTTAQDMDQEIRSEQSVAIEDLQSTARLWPTNRPDQPIGAIATSTTGPTIQGSKVTSPAGQMETQTVTLASTMQLAISPSGVDLETTGQDTAVSFASDALPIPPFSFTMDRWDVAINAPLLLDDQAKSFGLRLNLDAIALDDTTWAQVDPQSHIDRTPWSLLLDLGGDVIKSNGTEAGPADLGFLPKTLTIDDLQLRLGGALLSGVGAFQMAPAPGPMALAPEGKLALSLDGGLGLIGGLVKAGIIPQNQVMGLQMMLSMIARPDGDKDRLLSDIEVGPGQRLVINGTQLR